MSIDVVQPALGVQAVYPKQDTSGQSGRDPRRDGKPEKPEKPEQENQEQLFLNSLGQITGKTINITA